VKTVLHMIETGGTGGAETVYLNLVRQLDPTRWRHVAVLPTREWMYKQLVESGVQPVLMPEQRSFDAVFFARMYRLIRRLGVDLIHAHLFGSAVRAALLSRACGIPAIATLHGDMDLQPNERFKSLKLAIVNNGLKRIVFVSEPLRQSFLRSVPLRRDFATVILNGIDATRFSSNNGTKFRAELGIAPDDFVVGTVGTPRPAKGFDVLLDAAKILKSRSRGYRFVVVGDLTFGRGTALFEGRAARGLTEDVIITGFRSDVPCALAAFDVYALTSRYEGFSLALVEAMATGLPVVATRCGGPEQILDDGVTGILVENGSAEDTANAIERLRANADERRRLGNAARKAVRERFTLEAQVREYERLYEECLSSAGRKSRATRTSEIAQSQIRSG
jgi:glycosyltransferase involved in cell wall biosynthesis